jgi:2-hydroxychromene-2-carboxylate isomerase
MKSVDVYWSFRSPYSYLAGPDMLEVQEKFDVQVNLRVVLPIAVRSPDVLFTEAGIVRVKYIMLDWHRRADFLGMPHVAVMPVPDPIVQDLETFKIADDQPYIFRLSHLGVEAQRRGKGVEFAREISHLIFAGTENWNKGEHLAEATARAGLDLASMDEAITDGNHTEEITANQAGLEAAGHWGVPTFVFEGEPFFGQDRADTLMWRLDQQGLRKS